MKAAGIADVRHGFVAREHFPRGEQSLARDILMDAVACLLLELPHEVVLAEVDVLCERVDREVGVEVAVDVFEHLLDLFVIRRSVQLTELVREHRAVQENHELDEEDFCIEPVREAFFARRMLEFFHMKQQVMGKPRACMHDRRPHPCFLEACGEVVAVFLAAREECGRDVDDDALVRHVGREHGPVDFAGRDEDDVARHERIAAALDDVVGMAAEEQDDLVEVVIMEGNRRQALVFQPEHPKIAQQVALLFVRLQSIASKSFSHYRRAEHFLQSS